MFIYASKLTGEWDEQSFQQLLALVSEEKKARIVRFVHKKDAWRSLLADMLLRLALKKHFHLQHEELAFDTNTYGKPYLIGKPNIGFNLTHSGDWVGCVVGTSPVGIDIEEIRPIDIQIAKRFFTKQEYESLKILSPAEQTQRFYHLWTLKESCIKADGRGLSVPLNSFTFQNEDNSNLIAVHGLEHPYYCQTYELEHTYKLAVCSQTNAFPEGILIIDTSELIADTLLPSF